MYFEASKKSYYRFPSMNSVTEMDSKYYFPEKPYESGENTRLSNKSSHPSARSDNFLIMK